MPYELSNSPSAAFWARRRVAITGATGFVGRHLTQLLLDNDAEVVALVRRPDAIAGLQSRGAHASLAPLEDPVALRAALSGCDIVFHAAGAVGFSGADAPLRDVNVDGTRRLLEAAQAAGVRRAVVTSSIVAIGAASEPKSLDESAEWNFGRYAVPYVESKRTAELLALAQARGEFEVVVVNPAAVIGPGDAPASEFGLVCQRYWRGKIRFCFSGGMNFVDVRDVALGQLLAAERGVSGCRYILGGTNQAWPDFFANLGLFGAAPKRCLQLPGGLAKPLAVVSEFVSKRRPALTRASAKLLALYFYCSSQRAAVGLGYRPRPLYSTLADAHESWNRKRAA